MAFIARPFIKTQPHVRRPRFKSLFAATSPPPPTASPLKVWDGTTWQPTGVKIEP